MIRTLTLALAIACASTVFAKPKLQTEREKLWALLDREWEWGLKERPEFATEVGDPRYNERWTDYSPDAIKKRDEHIVEVLLEARKIDRKKLGPEDQLNLDLFIYDLSIGVESQPFHDEYMPINQMSGIHSSVAYMIETQPRATVKDCEDFLKRLRAVPALFEQNLILMRKGLEAGITPPRITLGEVAQQIANQIPDEITKAPLYARYFAEMPGNIAAEQQKRLRDEAVVVLRDTVYPAYKKLRAFWDTEYLPKTRSTIALVDLPDGKAWYAYAIKQQTTTALSAEEIHQLGLAEVKRIRGEMDSLMQKIGWKGDLKSFFAHLRSDKKFFFTERGQLLTAYRDISKRIDGELPRLFGTLPRLSYGVQPVPSYAEKTTTTAFYQPGSSQAGRAGTFYANTYDLASRPKWEMEPLTAHEAVPGHHLQIARAEELGDLPKFRRHVGYSAYVEGWGLYAESLGDELGLYKDPYSKFGQLTYEMWRAIRLVVDTGMHAKGWTRDQAIAFFTENAGKTAHDIKVEVDRYIVWPGQALAYKIGELKLKELRRAAATELGPRFAVRKFHDVVLGQGAMPLPLLDARVRAWMAAEKSKPAP